MMKIDLSMTSEVFFQPNKIVEVGELPGTLIAARVRLVQPGHFNRRRHFYPKAVDALIHPTLATFLSLGNEGIISRYHSLHPSVDTAMLEGFLNYNPKYFRWAGDQLSLMKDLN